MCDSATVLMVDDDCDIVLATCMRLRGAGFQTLEAVDGAEGIAVAIASRPELILLDVRMPRQDGMSALVELKRRFDTKHIPVIMLSASIVDQEAALNAGAVFFIRKPYSGSTLVQAVRVALAMEINNIAPTIAVPLGVIAHDSASKFHLAAPPETFAANVQPSVVKTRETAMQRQPNLKSTGNDSSLEAEKSALGARHPTKKRALIVDDDLDLARSMAIRCRGLGLEVEIASTMLSAIVSIQANPPDLLCLDVQLPTGNGLDLCEHFIRDSMPPPKLVIIVTGCTDSNTIRRSEKMRTRYLHKSPDLWNRMRPLVEAVVRSVPQSQAAEQNSIGAGAFQETYYA
ncbi:MAG: response regulator [Planctomycetota bacterium]|nr:response regulator [Planctomycetota bacterium]